MRNSRSKSSLRPESVPMNDEKAILLFFLNDISFEGCSFELSASSQVTDQQIPSEMMGTLIHINLVGHLK